MKRLILKCDTEFTKNILFILLFFVGTFKEGKFQNSPCPNIFKYYHENQRPIGVLRISNLQSTSTHINIQLSLASRLLSSYIGEIQPTSTNFDNEYQTSGDIIFKIYFPVTNPLPLLTAVRVNGVLVCSGPPAVGSYVSAVSLDYNFYLNQNSINKNQNFNSGFQQNNGDNQKNENNQQTFLNLNGNNQQNNWNGNYLTNNRPNNQNLNGNFQNNNGFNQQNNIINGNFGQTSFGYTPNNGQNNQISYGSNSSKKQKISKVCGNGKKVTSLIINGKTTERGDYPWHAAIFIRDGTGIKFICGGNLISDQHVLTAAHCLQLKDPKRYLVMLGKFELKKYNERGTEIRDVSDITINSYYTETYPDSDLGVIFLDEPVKFTNFINPICLYSPSMLNNIYGQRATVVGWGRNEQGEAVSNDLKELQINVIDPNVCRKSDRVLERVVTDNTFCAEGARKGSSACNGDSGGGVALRINDRWYLRGIISTALSVNITHPFCNPEKYFVLADIRNYYDWIEDLVFES